MNALRPSLMTDEDLRFEIVRHSDAIGRASVEYQNWWDDRLKVLLAEAEVREQRDEMERDARGAEWLAAVVVLVVVGFMVAVTAAALAWVIVR